MTREEIHTLLMQGLGLKKEPVALTPLREFPADMPAYEGLAMPGLCVQINEILDTRLGLLQHQRKPCLFRGPYRHRRVRG